MTTNTPQAASALSFNKTRELASRRLEKIIVNVGVGKLSQQANFEEKGLLQINRDLARITGQHPRTCRLKRSIAGFKAREGQIVGLQVTLRGARMVDFFERFIRIVLPRVRDFRGLAQKIVDKNGVLNVGLREHLVFPEISPEESPLAFPLGITVVPFERDREAALRLYREAGVPLKAEAHE